MSEWTERSWSTRCYDNYKLLNVTFLILIILAFSNKSENPCKSDTEVFYSVYTLHNIIIGRAKVVASISIQEHF